MENDQLGERDQGGAWRWPQLDFDVENIFAVGSPLAMFTTVRGEVDSQHWPKEGSHERFTFPGGGRLFNIFHPADPIAYRFEPLLSAASVGMTPGSVPVRGSKEKKAGGGKRTDTSKAEGGVGGSRARVDWQLQNVGTEGYSQLLGGITFSAHWCYFENKDLMLFLLEEIERQQMEHDFFETEQGRAWLRNASELLGKMVEEDEAVEGGGKGKEGGGMLEGAGRGLFDHFMERDSEKVLSLIEGARHSNAAAAKLAMDAREGMEKKEEMYQKGMGYVQGIRASNRELLQEHRSSMADSASRDAMGAKVKHQVLDFLTHYLSRLQVPPIAGIKQTGAGDFSYALGSIVLSGVVIPPGSVFTTFSGRNVVIKASEISAVLKGFTWIYKQRSMPFLRDNGSADADVKGLSLFLSFTLDPEAHDGQGQGGMGGWDRGVAATERVKIRELDIRLQKTPASWLYNAMLSLFSVRVKAAVEEALTSVLSDKIGVLSRELLPKAEEYIKVDLKT